MAAVQRLPVAVPIPVRTPVRVHALARRPVVYAILIVYALISTVLMATRAVGVTSEHAILIVLVVFSLIASTRPFVWDWLPFIGVAVMFSDLGTTVGRIGLPVHAVQPIAIERFLLDGNVAALWLQQHLRPFVPWLDAPLAAVYLSFFFAPTVFGVWLWIRHRAVFGTFVAAYIGVMAAGFLVHTLYAEAPPWLAARDGLLPHVDRITVSLLNRLDGFGRFYAGADPEPNGAMPALHVAVPTLIAATLVGIRGGHRSLRWLWLLYPLSMGLAVLYLGEHYLLDAGAGATLGALAYVVADRVTSRRERRAPGPDRPVLLFAHRGGMAHRRENTLDAFVHAQGLGIGGVETDAWVTADNVVVLHHDGRVRTPTGRRAIATMPRADLPAHVPSLADLYSSCGTGLDVAVDVLDARAAALCMAAARAADPSATRRLWLGGTDLEELASWRRLSPDVHLVHSDPDWRTHRRDLDGYLHELRRRGVDVLNLPARHCSGTVAAACHHEHVLLFAWGAQRVATIRRLQRAGVDGIMGNHVDRLVAATTGSSAITCDAR